jgi:glycerol uptake facilitator protein
MSAVFTESLVGLFQIASCWIIAVTVAIYCTSKISGAHLNPAISIALATFRDFEWRKVGPYSLAQLAGAVLGSATSYILYASTIQAFESANGIVRHSVKTGIISAKVFGEYFA